MITILACPGEDLSEVWNKDLRMERQKGGFSSLNVLRDYQFYWYFDLCSSASICGQAGKGGEGLRDLRVGRGAIVKAVYSRQNELKRISAILD